MSDDAATDCNTSRDAAQEMGDRRRSGRIDYTNPHLLALLRGSSTSGDGFSTLSDRELIGLRFTLARSVRSLSQSDPLSAPPDGYTRALVQLELCEIECRCRGLIS
jgi:hypothetical protein